MTTNNKEDDGTMAAAEQDRVEITVIVDQYRKAFAEMDMGLFKSVWDRDHENLVYIPQERAQPIHGWTDLERYFDSVESAFETVTVMTIDNLLTDVFGEVAHAYFTYHFEAETTEDDGLFTVDGRVTFVLRRKAGQWKLVHCHGSAPGSY